MRNEEALNMLLAVQNLRNPLVRIDDPVVYLKGLGDETSKTIWEWACLMSGFLPEAFPKEVVQRLPKEVKALLIKNVEPALKKLKRHVTQSVCGLGNFFAPKQLLDCWMISFKFMNETPPDGISTWFVHQHPPFVLCDLSRDIQIVRSPEIDRAVAYYEEWIEQLKLELHLTPEVFRQFCKVEDLYPSWTGHRCDCAVDTVKVVDWKTTYSGGDEKNRKRSTQELLEIAEAKGLTPFCVRDMLMIVLKHYENARPEDSDTSPTNDQILPSFKELGYSDSASKALCALVKPHWAPRGRRRGS